MQMTELHSNGCIVVSATSAAIAPPTSRGHAPRAEAFLPTSQDCEPCPAAALRPRSLNTTLFNRRVVHKRRVALAPRLLLLPGGGNPLRASSDSGDARGDGKFVPIRPQVEDYARARIRWACPTTKN